MTVLLGCLAMATPLSSAAAGKAKAKGKAKPKVAACAKEKSRRDKAYCLLLSENVAAMDPLLALGREMGPTEKEFSVSFREDFYYTAENAGVIAAKTKHDKLLTSLTASDPYTQRFAAAALGHMLFILDAGYANGGERDATRLADVKMPVGKACEPLLKAADSKVVIDAVKCVVATEEVAFAEPLVDVVVAATDPGVRRAAVFGIEKLPGLSQKKDALKRLAGPLALAMPASWSVDDVWWRAEVCGILARVVDGQDTGIKDAAQAAVREIGDKNSQASERCADLVAKAP